MEENKNNQNVQNGMGNFNMNPNNMNPNVNVNSGVINNMGNASMNTYSSDGNYNVNQMNQAVDFNQNMNNQNMGMQNIPNDMNQFASSNDLDNTQLQPKMANQTFQTASSNEKKQRFKYQIVNDQGVKETGFIDAVSKEDLQNYLENEGYQVVSIKPQSSVLTASIGGNKMKYSDLAFVLTQLSTYLKAGIPLIDSVKILEKQSVKPEQKRIFSNITYELVRGESFSYALERQGSTFPQLLINMVKTAELTGDLPSILDDMTEYYTSIDRTRKQVVSAMTYPIIIFIFALAVITFILLYIVPEFVSLFEQNNAEIPGITRFVIGASDFLTNNFFYVFGGLLLFLIVYTLCFKKIKSFRKTMQTLFMHLPVIGDIMIYKEVNMFTKTFASLLNHDVFITDSMAILSTISNNEVFKEIIQDSLDYLSRGAKISDSFKGKWAFPIVAYEMLVTGENTGRLPMMMEYVAQYYGDLHANYIKRLNTFIEPIMIVMLAAIVGTVVLSVIIPMFSFYSQINY